MIDLPITQVLGLDTETVDLAAIDESATNFWLLGLSILHNKRII